MAVRFILGRSGTGKTSYCVRAIADALLEPSEQPLLFLVPEQATYQAERAVLSDPRIAGFHRLHILSFDRLQFQLLGRNTARPALSRIGRQMIIHKILRDNLDRLQIFGSSALLPGFAREMAATITELHQYAKSPADIESLLAHLGALGSKEGGGRKAEDGWLFNPPSAIPNPQASGSPHLSALKFADIALVFRRYSEALQDKFIDPDAQITRACRAVVRADFIQGARLWVDGFASFTGGEMALLIEVLKTAEEACLALCVDPAECGLTAGSVKGSARGDATPPGNAGARVGLFEPTARTYRDLLERLAEARVRVGKPVILREAPRFRDCPALAHLEQNIFCLGAGRTAAGGSIRILAAPSLRLEIQSAARQILTLVTERGYRYRDIAVVASDLNQYEHYVRAGFEDYGIPFFIDKRKPLHQHPLVELVCAALQAVTKGLPHADVFAYLKTDLVPLARAEVDTLENYCLAFGVNGRDWADPQPWRFKARDDEEFDEDQINRLRTAAVGPLLELRRALCPEEEPDRRLTCGEFTRTVFAFLDRLRVRQTLGQWIEEAQESGDRTTANEQRQFFETFVDIFDTLVETFEPQEMTAQDYFGLLASAFAQMTLAFIPPSLDQVLVGSIERSRHPSLKAVFLVGATQKQFPVPLANAGVLSDEDRDAAEAADFQIAPSSLQSLTDRQYLAYIAFTRPSQFLAVSYPCVDEKGSPVMRSHFVDGLQSLFDDVAEEFVADDLPTLAEVRNRAELAELLCGRLGRDKACAAPTLAVQASPRGRLALAPEEQGPDALAAADGLADLLEAMQSDGECRSLAEQTVLALGYENLASLDPAVAKVLFGHRLHSSATRLTTFAACPYRYFAKYILELKPRREFKLEPLDLGLFYHSALDGLLKRLAGEKAGLADLEPDRLVQLVREQVAERVERDPFLAQFVRRSPHNAFVVGSAGRMLEECVLGIRQMVRAGSFRPVLTEAGFGHPRDTVSTLGPFELPLPEGTILSLDGKIDRLDVAQIDGREVALVFDYKRTASSAEFRWGDFFHGLDVQLALYMLAVHHGGAGIADEVAGAVYMPIETTPNSATLAELAEDQTRRFPYKAKGILNGAYWQHLDPNAGKESEYYSFSVTAKDRQPYGRYATSNILQPAHFARLLDWSRDRLVRQALDILSGRIEARPYHCGSERACTFCEYLGVCHFDWQINEYHFLPRAGKSDLIAQWEKP